METLFEQLNGFCFWSYWTGIIFTLFQSVPESKYIQVYIMKLYKYYITIFMYAYFRLNDLRLRIL